MQTEEWKIVKAVLDEVLELETSKRRNYLNKTNIKPEILAEVESLLAFEEAEENLIDLSAVEFSDGFFDEEEQSAVIEQMFGVYRVVRELGYGGIGAVFLAERCDGKFEQKVAVKMLKRELNVKKIRRNFEREREILSKLEHPNIARLLDAGTTGDGVPLKTITETEVIKPSEITNYELRITNGEGNLKSKIQNPKSLRGDLDNIILKSLRKEPERRYKTVEQFSSDIWRHLDGLPVTARPTTLVYRLNKFYNRNKIAVFAGVLIFLSLIAGIFAAMREKKLANEQANIALESRNLAQKETEKAQTEQEKSEKITRFMSKIISYANPKWYGGGAKLGKDARVIDAVLDLADKIDEEFANDTGCCRRTSSPLYRSHRNKRRKP